MTSGEPRSDIFRQAEALGEEPYLVELFTDMGVIRVTLIPLLALEAAQVAWETVDEEGEHKFPVFLNHRIDRVYVLDGLTWYWMDQMAASEPIQVVADDGVWAIRPTAIHGVRVSDTSERGEERFPGLSVSNRDAHTNSEE